MNWNCSWIKPAKDPGDGVPAFEKQFTLKMPVKKAVLSMTALGTYEASINGTRVSQYVLAPGWTSYKHRLQYQTYDVTGLLQEENSLTVLVGKGWYRSPLMGWQHSKDQQALMKQPAGLFAQLELTYEDGTGEIITTDESWTVSDSCIRFSEIYDGEICDAAFEPDEAQPAVLFDGPTGTLIPQQGPEIREQEHLFPARIFTTPKGEHILDFGQEVTGFLQVTVTAQKGDVVDVSFGEVLDKEGNFYNDNYRGAKAQYHYICRDGEQTCKTRLTFYGFRYIRVNQFPGGPENAGLSSFTAIAVHSQMERTGNIRCSDPMINRLFSNIIWGQKGNFLDVPTDCPQRDERFGWTGDAQVFVRTACMNYDVEQFFAKWLGDMAADQGEDGFVGHVIPDILPAKNGSAAWGDAAVICPWEVYLAYGNPSLLETQYDMMCKWVSYIGSVTTTPFLWTGCEHYGDWLGLDAPVGSYKGSSREDFIASAFYAYSASLVIKAGKALGKDTAPYEELYKKIVTAFRETYPTYHTQTECVLAAHFRLARDPQKAADQLARMVAENGVRLQTGFVGTPYLLHTLSEFGYPEMAYTLLLRREYPSWLYPVTKGATTIWEHWDGVMENGDFWSRDMNSFNHYAYGSVADWIYGVCAGIRPVEDAPGYEKVKIAPVPSARLEWLEASLKTRHGQIISRWTQEDGMWRYEITTPVEAEITIAGETQTVPAGSYLFFSPVTK